MNKLKMISYLQNNFIDYVEDPKLGIFAGSNTAFYCNIKKLRQSNAHIVVLNNKEVEHYSKMLDITQHRMQELVILHEIGHVADFLNNPEMYVKKVSFKSEKNILEMEKEAWKQAERLASELKLKFYSDEYHKTKNYQLSFYEKRKAA